MCTVVVTQFNPGTDALFFKRPPFDLQNMTFCPSKHGLLDLKT